MKKTMFITSVIMVVVMAIALTTSSLAWFSASGQDNVTTSTLALQAKAQAAAGIQISTDGAIWSNNIDLDGDNSMTNLMPVMPYDYRASGDDSTAKDPLYALYNDKFIGNEIDNNNVYVGDADIGVANTDFFSTTFKIANVSQGSSSGDVVVGPKYITPTIRFLVAGQSGDVKYTYNSLDAVLYVAVLADMNVSLTNGNSSYPTASEPDWKIIRVFSSAQSDSNVGATDYINTSVTTINFGGQEELFAAGGNALGTGSNNSWAATSIADDIQNKTSALQPCYENAAIGEVKNFKVVAWYDGASLKNSNSGNTLKFALKFNATNS